MHLSVIICSHNPREDYLERTLAGLKAQTLPSEQWELLLVDNASDTPLEYRLDLSWHSSARHIRELKPGLTHARIRSIRESRGDLLVFVDDDNVLDGEYLETALHIATDREWLGAFGGSVIGEFEVEPPTEFDFILPHLAIRKVDKPSWCLHPGVHSLYSAPCGAGLVIRRSIAEAYVDKVLSHPLRAALDRTGTSLSSGGDTDMVLCACEAGLAVGQFPELTLIHLIPRSRLEKAYLLRLMEGMGHSLSLLKFIWHDEIPADLAPGCRIDRLVLRYKQTRARLKRLKPSFQEEAGEAHRRGCQRAREELQRSMPHLFQQRS